jgi:hypothetical protein
MRCASKEWSAKEKSETPLL